ncbi:MAG: putative RNA uridine N3 methyltransferase [Candidatus Bathyarchaeia archaeon]|jgi:predicted SPOUT superfamily RNA methylase MTH1
MKKLYIAIPASVVSDTPHLREKTSKIGLIGRAAAIFRVNEIIIYPDCPGVSQRNDVDLVATLLAYMETPQYLRKTLFKLNPILQYAGILPPLRTQHHPLNRRSKDLKVGEYREGVALSKTEEGTLVDIGVESPALVMKSQLTAGRRVTVRIVRTGKPVKAELVNRDEVPTYWGYLVTVEKHRFGEMIKSRSFDLTIATSKYGLPFAQVTGQIVEEWVRASSALLAFGAPALGLNEIVAREGLRLEDIVDFVVNTIPSQGTETVRTEEALIASLAVFNITLAARM